MVYARDSKPLVERHESSSLSPGTGNNIVIITETYMLSWVNPKIEARGAGEKGRGLFAVQKIKKNEVVAITAGRIFGLAQLDSDPALEPIRYHCFQIEKDFVICPSDVGNFDAIFLTNHSCDPTCGIRGQVTLVAFRDIEPGEEITFDYAMTDSCEVTMDCLCGASNCRGVVTGEDWKRKDLQEKYRGYFSDYLERMIAESRL
jgi:uncharacterized protein